MNKFFLMAAAMLGMSATTATHAIEYGSPEAAKLKNTTGFLRAMRYRQEPLSRNASQNKRRKLVRQNPHLLRSKKFKK